jgi:DNA-binding response OmpR family regulator
MFVQNAPVCSGRARNDRLRVLVVDDDRETTELFAAMLRSDGFEAVCAMNAHQALAMASEGFDVVCTDLRMPGRDGIELIRELRQARVRPMPIIAISAQPRDVFGPIANNAGGCSFISKPCTLEEVVGAVRMLLSECQHDCGDQPERCRHSARHRPRS